MADDLTDFTLELADDLATELEELAPRLEELAERASGALFAVTWDERTEEPPEAAERLHRSLVRLARTLTAAAT